MLQAGMTADKSSVPSANETMLIGAWDLAEGVRGRNGTTNKFLKSRMKAKGRWVYFLKEMVAGKGQKNIKSNNYTGTENQGVFFRWKLKLRSCKKTDSKRLFSYINMRKTI